MGKKIFIVLVLIMAVLTMGMVIDYTIKVKKILLIENSANTVLFPEQIASAAGVLTIGRGTTYRITGTATITRLYTAPADTTPYMQGRIIYLHHAGADTIADGGNLKLAGNFPGTADDVLVLQFTDSTWKEISRSAN